jgi:hypothetical protein
MEHISKIVDRVLEDVQASRERRRQPAPRETGILVEAMAKILVANDVDLADDRLVMRCLEQCFRPDDVDGLHDAAVEAARVLRAKTADLSWVA